MLAETIKKLAEIKVSRANTKFTGTGNVCGREVQGWRPGEMMAEYLELYIDGLDFSVLYMLWIWFRYRAS